MSVKFHFLNVGHGDCTFVELHSGRLMMVDINNSKSLPDADVVALASRRDLSVDEFKRPLAGRSWEDHYRSLLVDPSDYHAANFSGRNIFRYVQTHPDMDHLSGLHRVFWQDAVPLENFWDTEHNKELTAEDFEGSRFAEADWLVYQLLREGRGPPGPSGQPSTHKVLHNLRGGVGDYWTEDSIEILSPSQFLINECNEAGAYNNSSYVLKVSHAGRSVILPGDAEATAWRSILTMLGPEVLDCDVLKAAHHGRESGYHEEAVEAMSPEVVICSVGKKPETDASNEYASHGASVKSTRFHGTITARIWDDGDIWISDHAGNRLHTIE